MKVIAIKGKAKSEYTLYYAAGKQTTELPQKVQQCLQALGEIFLKKEIDLTGKTDTHSNNILKGIDAEGAYFEKTTVEFTESVVPSSQVPGDRR